MNQENWKFILAYLSDQENEEKKRMLADWLAKDPLHQQQLDQALWLWKETAVTPENEEWKDSFQAIQNSITPEPVPHTTRLWSILAFSSVAAAVICALFVLFYKQEVPAGKTLTAWLSKTADAGKVIKVMLPDSTEIWLNSGSRISYPENLQHAALRTVRLTGEAFFKVKRDPKHPFIVHSLNLQTRVLGTSFNIRAWAGHTAEVTVLTGKVAVSKDSAGQQSMVIHLLPGQKAVYDHRSAALSLQQVEEAALSTSWTTGKMEFEQLPLKEVFETIERRYAVHIISSDIDKGCKLTAHFNNVSLTEVLNTLQLTLGIHYTINNNNIHIKGGTCN